MEEMTKRVTRLRWAVLVLVLVVVFAATAAPIYVIKSNQRQAIQTQLAVTCTSAVANVEQLTALNEIAERLGIPHDFTVPTFPPECAP